MVCMILLGLRLLSRYRNKSTGWTAQECRFDSRQRQATFLHSVQTWPPILGLISGPTRLHGLYTDRYLFNDATQQVGLITDLINMSVSSYHQEEEWAWISQLLDGRGSTPGRDKKCLSPAQCPSRLLASRSLLSSGYCWHFLVGKSSRSMKLTT